MIQILKKSALAIFLLLSVMAVFPQGNTEYEIGTWQGFRSCAISYTFDDGCSGQFSKAIPIFNEMGYKLTLFTVSGWTGNWTNLKNAAASEHEVACHTATHPNLSSMTVEAQKTEIETCNKLIDKNITSQKCLTMATPYCAEGNDELAAQYFIAVRGCQGVIESKTPANFMNVSSVICGDQGAVKTSANFKTQATNAATKKGWLVYLIHGIDNDGGYSPLPSDTLKKSLEYLSQNDGKFWVNTFGNVARYIKERNCATVTETAATETSLTVSITDTLSNDEWYNYPLTIRRPLPDGWNYAEVTQNGLAVTDTIIEVNSVKYIQFDAIPDGGSVIINKKSGVGTKDLKSSMNSDLKIWVNPQGLQFRIPDQCSAFPTVSIFDIEGSKLACYENIGIENGLGQVNLTGIVHSSGIYLFHLSDRHNVWAQKFMFSSI